MLMSLLPFQKEFLAWAISQERSEIRGGILADEMGMGKTIQVLPYILVIPHSTTCTKYTASFQQPCGRCGGIITLQGHSSQVHPCTVVIPHSTIFTKYPCIMVGSHSTICGKCPCIMVGSHSTTCGKYSCSMFTPCSTTCTKYPQRFSAIVQQPRGRCGSIAI